MDYGELTDKIPSAVLCVILGQCYTEAAQGDVDVVHCVLFTTFVFILSI